MTRLRAELQAQSTPIALPELVVVPTHADIFMFSAVTWNRHHVHYSKDAALEEGLPDVVVQRAMLGDYLARSVSDWAGDEAEIREITWKVLRSATPGMRLRCQGAATDVSGTSISCDLRIVRDDDELISSGTARLELAETIERR